ncbi:MAG: hypothetical protein GF368_04755 [Candidatus Aenigmarchaeota archaeon]|nr:hypothetical protein [Candidatus Aenigmarchaeota archaeon]
MKGRITYEELQEMGENELGSILVVYSVGIGLMDEGFLDSLRGLRLKGIYLLDGPNHHLLVPGQNYREVEVAFRALDEERYGDRLDSMPPREPFRILREIDLS